VLELRQRDAGMTAAPEPTFFRAAAELQRWFGKHHASAGELHVGYWKVGSGRPSITWPQSVDEALCVGWIDGVRKRIDDASYMIRFTPRRATSIWSAVNVARFEALDAQGRITAAGQAAFAARREDRSRVYSFEQGSLELPADCAALLRGNAKACVDFDARAPSYRKAVIWWIVSAKQEATRRRRLALLIEHGERGHALHQFSRR
jgi:uncharacterized protein YdeI (YjbR/CyaY-like superfamily)